jgi:uncharacterized RDD family membrane protein YckC
MTAAYEQASLFLEGASRNRREIVTPEGVPLPVEIATFGERATAFALDWFIQILATVLVYLFIIFAFFGSLGALGKNGGAVIVAILLLLAFLIRNVYFIHFELAWQGATPGKRAVGLRVIDRRGGPLLPTAVIARNLTREVEIFMPLGVLMSPASGSAVWENLSLAAWLLAFAFLPLFNRDRLRGGDLIAGTMVVVLPRRVLLGDLVERSARYHFTDRQLDAYGAFELQVLEELLRRPHAPDAERLRREVCDKISRKIGWRYPVPDADALSFLVDFYTAERAYLEREQLFGKPRTDKHHQRNPAAGEQSAKEK